MVSCLTAGPAHSQQNQKLSQDNTELKRHLQLTLNRLEDDDNEISQCRKEITKHLGDLDTARKANVDYQKMVSKEKEDHSATVHEHIICA